jgi:hypothetical protein
MRFLVLFSLVLAGLSGTYFGFIRIVDPYGESGTGRFPVLVLDSRRAKLRLLHQYAEHGPVEGLILGSSRSLLMRPESLSAGGNERIFNFAVDNAHAEDFLSIYHYALAQGASPKVLIIGLDVASLQSDDVHDHMFDRSELRDYLDQGHTASGRSIMQFVDDTKSLFTKDYLKDAFKAIVMKARHQTPRTNFRPDGYEVLYSQEQVPSGHLGADHDFSGDVKSYLERLSGMHELSQVRLGYLRQLFTEAGQHHTEAIVWLTPIHVRLNQLIDEQTDYPNLIAKVNAAGREWASVYGVHYRDFSNVKAFGGEETGWNDSTHMDCSNMDLVARALTGEVKHGF